jgi:hypothetical protein
VKKLSLVILCAVVVCGCQRGPSEVADKVLADFGLREQPEGTVTGSDKVMDRLATVGKMEMSRMNVKGREGEVKFQEDEGLQGKYYKEVKKYDAARAVDATAVSNPAQSDRGYVGYIDYSYEIYQSERRNTKVEAAALDADIPTGVRGRETYRYNFSSGGAWQGGEGELVKK